MKKYYTISETAKECKVTYQALCDWIEACNIRLKRKNDKPRLLPHHYQRLLRFNELRLTGEYTIKGCAKYSANV